QNAATDISRDEIAHRGRGAANRGVRCVSIKTENDAAISRGTVRQRGCAGGIRADEISFDHIAVRSTALDVNAVMLKAVNYQATHSAVGRGDGEPGEVAVRRRHGATEFDL